MTLTNLRKWLPIYRHCKRLAVLYKETGHTWAETFLAVDSALWAGFEGLVSGGFYVGIVSDYKSTLRAITANVNSLYKEVA